MDLFNPLRCQCESCTPHPTRTFTRAWMRECEIRSVVALPSNAARRDYLDIVEKHRGFNAATRLRQAVWEQLRELT